MKKGIFSTFLISKKGISLQKKMKMKKSSLLLLFAFVGFSINAQTAEELKKEQAPKKAEIEKLQGEVNSLQDKIDAHRPRARCYEICLKKHFLKKKAVS